MSNEQLSAIQQDLSGLSAYTIQHIDELHVNIDNLSTFEGKINTNTADISSIQVSMVGHSQNIVRLSSQEALIEEDLDKLRIKTNAVSLELSSHENKLKMLNGSGCSLSAAIDHLASIVMTGESLSGININISDLETNQITISGNLRKNIDDLHALEVRVSSLESSLDTSVKSLCSKVVALEPTVAALTTFTHKLSSYAFGLTTTTP